MEEFDARRAAEEGSGLEEEHWRHLVAYLEVVKPFEEATKLLGGDSYPASTMVIPMLDQVPTNIVERLFYFISPVTGGPCSSPARRPGLAVAG